MTVSEMRPVSAQRTPPDPAITSAIGRHHSLETAIADLVDNSIDAGAANVLIRFVLDRGRAVGLQVIDDGHGMDSSGVDAAMRYAHRRDYGVAALGHFGVGLKAASLSQADTLLVWSRRFGAPAVGRRLRRESLDSGPLVETFASHDAEERLAAVEGPHQAGTGTLVEWQNVRSFLHDDDSTEQTKWLESVVEKVSRHLGIVLHRLLTRGSLVLRIELREGSSPGAPRPVRPIDPFDHAVSGARGYPVDLVADLPEGAATLRAHALPTSGTNSAAFVLDGRGPQQTQGLYVYRNDRLLQAGGWCDLFRGTADLSFARVSVDLTPELLQHVTFNPEKTGVVLDSTSSAALLRATSADGRTWQDFFDAVSGTAKAARKRSPRPISLVEPGGGLPAQVHEAFEDAVDFDDGEDPVDIRWRMLPEDQFFRVDLESKRLELNLTYRASVVGRTKSMDPSDAPLVKSLIFLLLNSHLSGTVRGTREKRLEAAWQKILVEAVRAEPGPHNQA